MSYAIISVKAFDKRAKRLARKFPSFTEDLVKLIHSLAETPAMGTPLGQDCYKIRLAITSKGKGKSGGARVITFLMLSDETVVLLDIFDKSEQENIPEKQLAALRTAAIEQLSSVIPPPPDSENPPSGEAP